MVVQCPKCKTKYEVADMDVPTGGCAVQCLECSNVFTIYREPLDIKLTPYRENEFEPSVREAKEILKSNIEFGMETPVTEEPVRELDKESVPFTGDPEKMKQHRKAERLGRSLVKDIYLYHKDKVEQGRRDGTLVQLLGEEIKKSWKFYKKQIDPEILQEKNYFKDALNEIIAEGKEVFK
ncbi:MAG: zinc-ribbon domain-containing protein [candidate division WOR-3 bacterium]|jgi:predicted Zn finger-like uncharacterized protein